MVISCLVIAFFGVCFASIGSYFSICSQCTLYLGLCGGFFKLFISFCHLFIRIYSHFHFHCYLVGLTLCVCVAFQSMYLSL